MKQKDLIEVVKYPKIACGICSARSIYKYLGIKKSFTSWFKKRVIQLKLVEDKDFFIFKNSTLGNRTKGRPRIEIFVRATIACKLVYRSYNSKGDDINFIHMLQKMYPDLKKEL